MDASPVGEADRPRSQTRQKNTWTQADRDFIRAARDSLHCGFYFFVETLSKENSPDMTGKVIVVDRYFLQVEFDSLPHPVWVAKNAILAIEIPASKK